MLIKLGFWTPVLFFLTLKSGFPETSSQLTPSSSEESCKPSVPRGRLSQSGTRSSNPASSSGESDANLTQVVTSTVRIPL